MARDLERERDEMIKLDTMPWRRPMMNPLSPTPAPRDTSGEISPPELDEYLALYPQENRRILSARYHNRSLTASLQHFPYPFTQHDLDYVTATQLTLYLSQLTYVLIGAALRAQDHPDIPARFTDHFFSMMHAGRLFFVDLRQKMRRPIWKSDSITATLDLTETRRTSTTFFVFIAFDINNRSCAGTLTVGTETPA
jgi:hypothetical protein